jgi:FAD/FMN-containing dehydrogenase
LWGLRREFSYSLRDTGLVKLNQDIVVPRGRLEDLFAFTARLQKKSGLPIACFGHAGDGNIHVNVMYDANGRVSKSARGPRWTNYSGKCWLGTGSLRGTRHRPGQETVVAAGGFARRANAAPENQDKAWIQRGF